ncbi:MAG: ATP-binding cassette domain-containing protein [Bacilli bacterium]|nr:ATP-binding cassette domain-containing protein [Bacilli bacterium]
MLKLSNIKKDYTSKGIPTVHALKGITLNFRRQEFVAILGHSGCGKTTLLNIIGGLDHYTSGDLIIEGRSTKKFKDGDWNTYRNHSIGFVFQSYNLIPHQTILKNVELALTISGVKRKERIELAKKALDEVGLKGLYGKKPNQLSGGQCQRVAIARSLVNDPEIVLADEPTGALDSETSVQIMDLLAKVSKSHLIIMVTHNPELAEKYATRIVRMKDGKIVSDSKPYKGETEKEREVFQKKLNTKVIAKKKKSSMSFFTAVGLSFSNLFSKFSRTLLVAIASSIGIIGVSSILGVSCGVNNYIDKMENDLLSSYPLAISEQAVDTTSLLTGLSSQDKSEIAKFDTSTKVGMDSMVAYLMSKYTDFTNIKTNDISEELISYIDQMPESYYAAKNYDYKIDPTNNLFTKFVKTDYSSSEEKTKTSMISINGLSQQYIKTLKTVNGFGEYAAFVDLFTNFMKQLPGEENYILSQYDMLGKSTFPSKDNELMLVTDKDTTLTDLVLAQMGYYPEKDFLNIAKKAVKSTEAHKKYINGLISAQEYLDLLKEYEEKYKYETSFNMDDILNHDFYYFPHDSIYDVDPDFVTHKNVTISLSGTIPFLNYSIILGLNYEATTDSLLGTLIALDSENNIVMNQSLILYRDVDSPKPDENQSIVNGSWSINYQGSSVNLVIDSHISEEPSPDPKTSNFTATATLTTNLIGFPVPLTSGKIVEVDPDTPDYWYNANISLEDDMIKNPEKYGGIKVKVSAILRPKSDTMFGSLSRGVYYTKAFAERYINDSSKSQIVTSFKEHVLNKKSQLSTFNAYVKFFYDDYSKDDGTEGFKPKTREGYASSLNNSGGGLNISNIVSTIFGGSSDNFKSDSSHIRSLAGLKVTSINMKDGISVTDAFKNAEKNLLKDKPVGTRVTSPNGYDILGTVVSIGDWSDAEGGSFIICDNNDITKLISCVALRDKEDFDALYIGAPVKLMNVYFDATKTGPNDDDISITTSSSTLKIAMGEDTIYTVDLVPQTIQIYPKSFKTKDLVTNYLNRWNSESDLVIGGMVVHKTERKEITVTDTISIIVSTIEMLVTAISVALIAFTSLSLVVSCFMIAVITIISVMERIKEIGVIRSLGGRKKDVSRLFIAENIISGIASGALGIGITYIVQLILNLSIAPLGIKNICDLPWYLALLMVGIAILLSVLSGLIPSIRASKKDPVLALRSE